MTLSWATGTHPGRVRTNNEDRLHPPTAGRGPALLAAVADGMGGHVGGEVASRIAVETATARRRRAMTDRVRLANEAIYERSLEDQDLAGMGTTLTIADVSQGGVLIGHVGDSRCYLIRDGELRLLTRDHTVAYEQLESRKITEEEAAQHPQRHVLTRVLGLLPVVDVDIVEEPLEPGDRLLMCSDGLNGMITDAQILETAATGSPEEAVWGLIERANLAGGYDNISVVIVDVEP